MLQCAIMILNACLMCRSTLTPWVWQQFGRDAFAESTQPFKVVDSAAHQLHSYIIIKCSHSDNRNVLTRAVPFDVGTHWIYTFCRARNSFTSHWQTIGKQNIKAADVWNSLLETKHPRHTPIFALRSHICVMSRAHFLDQIIFWLAHGVRDGSGAVQLNSEIGHM